MGVYYTTYVLGDVSQMGTFAIAINLPMMLGLVFVPILVKKLGIYRTNLYGMSLTILIGIPLIWAGFTKNIPVILLCLALRSAFSASLMGTLNAIIAEISGYTFRKTGVRIEGSMYSCSSLGIKIGSGIGSGASGWLLAWGGYNGALAVQSAGTNSMITVVYFVIPVVLFGIIALFTKFLNVQQANNELDAKQAEAAA